MKIKNMCALLGAVTALAAVSVSGFNVSAADTDVNASLMNTEFQTEQDSEFTTTIYVPENSNITNFQAVLNYNSDYVKLVEAKPYESEAGTILVNEKNGKINLSFTGVENQTEKISVVDLTFHVAEDLAANKYEFISLEKTAFNSASSNTESGDQADYAVKSSFSTLDIYDYGDSNLDGKIKANDVSWLKQYIVKMRDISDLAKKYSNTNIDFEEDGVTPKINARDALKIQQKVVEMDVTLGDRVNVTFYDKNGDVYAKKSVKAGGSVTNIPGVPELTGYGESSWSLSPDEHVDVDLSEVKTDLEVFAVYGEEDEKIKLYEKVCSALDEGFTQQGKYIADKFQLPYKSNHGEFNMLSSKEFEGLDIIWSIDSGVLAQSVNISKDYVVGVPTGDKQIPYTTWVAFTANIYFNGVKYGTKTFDREIQGKIDIPDSSVFSNVIKKIPKEISEDYRLPGYLTLENERLNYGVSTVQNVDIQWSVVKNSDGSTADSRVLDPTSNALVYLKDETNVTLQADFIFDGNVVYTERISRTIPAKSIEGQIEYAENYIKKFVPSVISGETYFPTSVPLYDLTVSWIPDIESGKVDIGRNENVNGVIYKVIGVGEKAGYMEWAKAYANIERNGDKTFKQTGLEFDVQLAGNSSEISTDKIPDVNLYNALVNIFDKKYGNKDGILTEEEIYDTEVMEKLNYTVDLSGKNISNISGIKYLKYYRKIDLSNNDLGGTNASLSDLAGMNYLEQISLSNCNISEMPESVFASKHLIEGIDLSYNKLKDVNFLSLKDGRTHADCAYTELKELFLQGNYITNIDNLQFVNDQGDMVSRIPNVNILTLSRDLAYYEYKTGEKTGKKILKEADEYLYDIKASMNIEPLGLLKNVSTLWLANNFITDISPLENCKLLATLDLSGNSISATASYDGLAPISRLQSLVCLKLDNNADIHTVKSLKRLIYLDTLSLSNNHIGNTSGILDSLTNLTYLDLDGNELTSFDADNFKYLTRLYLENNELVQVVNLSSAPGLTELRLNGNNIDMDSVRSIGKLKNLRYLSLSDNTVVDLDFLKDLVSLTHLELARCKIRQNLIISTTSNGETKNEEIDNMSYISGLTDLLLLDISENEDINNIDALSTLTKLGVFYANNVPLKTAMSVRSMTKLQYLSMQNSGLEDLSFLNTLNILEFINLSGHKATAFDFRNLKNFDNVVGIFLDSASGTEAINIGSMVNKQNLRYLTVANMNIGSVDSLPDMDSITYLGLRNTGISDFNGSYSETDGYIYPITRFTTLKYIDVADNPELFTKKNLEMLYDFVGEPNNKKSIILYRDNAPEGYVPGIMNPDIEAVRIKDDISFGNGGEDVLSAMKAGYPLQSTLNGYDVEWKLEDNDLYYVKEGKLYFKNTDVTDASAKLALTMDIKELYYREDNPNTNPETQVSFTASIKTVSELKPTGEKKFVETKWMNSSQKDVGDGWTRDDSKTESGYTDYGAWSSWSTTAVTKSDLRQVETKTEKLLSDWGEWSNWITDAVNGSDLRDVQTKQEPYSYSTPVYFPACASSYTSLTDALKSVGVDHNYANSWQAKIPMAELNGVYNYTGTYDQNITLLNKLKSGSLIREYKTNTGYTTYYRYRDRHYYDQTYYRFRDRSLIPTVYYFYKDIYEPVMKEVITGMTLVVE